ncbi:MAG: mannose-6-phosphate isomerase, class I [Treponemataceae bacterium]
MTKIFRIRNAIKTYDWGSTDLIPAFLSEENTEKKNYAEIWMGAHPNDPSIAQFDKKKIPLNELIEDFPEDTIGTFCKQIFGNRLPYLFKILAVEHPLSLQAHPDKSQAVAGWRKENEAGIPLDEASRNYKDDNHKPEILCALTPFRALCGFRQPVEIRQLLDIFDSSDLTGLRETLNQKKEGEALTSFFSRFNGLSSEHKRSLLDFAANQAITLQTKDALNARIWRIVEQLATSQSADSAVIAPLFLNDIELAPGQAIYVPSGILHAYLSGMGVELMANSDNVLRGGLTKKHIDMKELLAVLRFEPYKPPILKPSLSNLTGLCYFDIPAAEFRLFELNTLGENERHPLPPSTPSIIIIIEGAFDACCDSDPPISIKKGESVFISASATNPYISGKGLAYIASVPS